jgi:hypothetical protein
MSVDFGDKICVWSDLGCPVFGANSSTLMLRLGDCVDKHHLEELSESLWEGAETTLYYTLRGVILEAEDGN